jgi:putative peptidoglycan lipid II flippase
VFALMLPVTLGLGLINLNVLVDTWFAANVDRDIGPAAVDKAFRIYMLPQGMFSVAVAAVLFPALARRAAARDGPGFRDLLGAGLRQIAFLLLPAAALCAALATPMVRLLYEHGNFTPHDTAVVAACLAAFSAGLAFNGAMLLLNRAYLGMQKAWIPTSIAVANLILNGVLDWIFTRTLSLDVWSIPLATSIVNIVGVALLYMRLRPVAGRLDERELVRALVRIVIASALAVGAGYGVWRLLDELLGQFVVIQLVTLGAGLAVAAGVYLLAAQAMHIEELEDVRSLVRRRRAAPAGDSG